MPPDKRKIAADCWRKGTEAMSRENWDYAIDMFGKSVALVPDNLTYRQTLRGCECKKYHDNKTGARMAGVRLMAIRGRIKKARMKEDWRAIDRAAEEGLTVNPWDPQLNADLAQACHELGFDEVALYGYQKAVERDPDNILFNRSLALLLADRGNFADAIRCWQHIHKLNPLDGEARTNIKALEAEEVMDHGGYEGAKSTRDVKDVKSAYDLDRPVKRVVPDTVEGPGVSVEADLKRAIRKEPEDTNNYLKLGDYYRRGKKLQDAAQMYRKALEISGGDSNVREQLEDVELDQLRHNLVLAKEAVDSNSNDEAAKTNLASLRKEVLHREINVLSGRVERYPKDSRLKFELAQRLMPLKKWPQAIQLLQQASADSRLECEVAVALSECFLADKKANLARRQLDRIVEKISRHDQTPLFKKAHYMLGRMCETAGDRELAEFHYFEILGIDYDYKDTRQRLERLQAAENRDGPGED